MNGKNMKGNLGIRPRIHREVLEDVKELLDDGITISNASNYTGVSQEVIEYHFSPEKRIKHDIAVKKWKEKNKERDRNNVSSYQKRVREKLKYEQNIC